MIYRVTNLTAYLIVIPVFLLVGQKLYGQEQKSVLQLANEAYARQEYAVAGPLYDRLARREKGKLPVDQWMRLARSYQETGQFREAAGAYQQIIACPGRPASAYFAYGETLRQLEQYKVAREQYLLFSTTNADSIQMKEMALQSCDSAIVWRQQQGSITLKPLNELNTPGSDLVSGEVNQGLLLMSTGYRTLELNGRVEPHPGTDKRTGNPFYKAYVYKQYSADNTNRYLEELLPNLLGDYNYHIGPVSFNKTEDTLYATVNVQGKGATTVHNKSAANGVRQLKIYQSVKMNGKWSRLALLPGINIPNCSSSHAVLNKTGNILYFVSDRPGGLGQTDLWYCEKQPDGAWGIPVNCGDKINTVEAETFPTVNEEGILYFSSKGHIGFGGYDIYRAKGEKNGWETPENMKLPFNSGGDDISLVLENDGYEGYLSSNKAGGQGGDDIYYFVDPSFFNQICYVKKQTKTDSGYAVTPMASSLAHTAEEEADRQQLEQLQFYYDYNSAILLKESREILNMVAAALKRHPNWKIMVISYADCRGSDQYNTDLSALRCFAVTGYLVDKGIHPGRLYYSNRGKKNPVNGCNCENGVSCKEAEYKQNRRSELSIRW